MAIPPGFLEASYIHEIPGSTKPMINVWGHLNDFPSTVDDTVAEELWNEWVLSAMKCINNDIRLREVVVRVGQDGGPPTIDSFSGSDSNGTLPGEALPNNCATLLKKNTALGGRRGRGRCYLPPVGEESSGGGRLDPSTVGFIGSTMNVWVGSLAAKGLAPHILHDGGLVTTPPTEVTSVTCDSLLATQRRRLR